MITSVVFELFLLMHYLIALNNIDDFAIMCFQIFQTRSRNCFTIDMGKNGTWIGSKTRFYKLTRRLITS